MKKEQEVHNPLFEKPFSNAKITHFLYVFFIHIMLLTHLLIPTHHLPLIHNFKEKNSTPLLKKWHVQPFDTFDTLVLIKRHSLVVNGAKEMFSSGDFLKSPQEYSVNFLEK